MHILVGIVKYIHLSTLDYGYKRSLCRKISNKNRQTIIVYHKEILELVKKEFSLFPSKNDIAKDIFGIST